MLVHARRGAMPLVLVVVVILASGGSLFGQASPAGIPHLGKWQLNLAKSTFNGSRAGSPTFAWT